MGNVISGWEVRRNPHHHQGVRKEFTDADRIFSLTSMTAKKNTPLVDTGHPIEVPPPPLAAPGTVVLPGKRSILDE